MTNTNTPEHERLEQYRQHIGHWKRWGPYLSDRAWGTVREDYSANGTAWEHFPHDQARSRAYRWNEDGLMGISDHNGRLCLALALWNGVDPILKERLFGLTGNEGNHGEDVKEHYFYLESTPTHSYMKGLYKYPQAEFPYSRLVEENRRRGKSEPEFELFDTGIFNEQKYWDVEIEYAKADSDDILMRVTVHNRGPQTARLHVLPTLWFRNTWSWGYEGTKHHTIQHESAFALSADHPELGKRHLYFEADADALFCENETNLTKLYNVPNHSSTAKDGINDLVVHGRLDAANRIDGSKAAIWHQLEVAPGASKTVRVRFSAAVLEQAFHDFDMIFERRKLESDEFFDTLEPAGLNDDQRLVQRQAFAGMLWSKQFYHYNIEHWLEGDPAGPPPPESRKNGRNRDWRTLNTAEIISMPDCWEYPWFAAWDLAFHTIPLALLDPEFAKNQLLLLTKEWYQHPNGQLPAYEWQFSDVNPPVHAWAVWRVYQTEQEHWGRSDRAFLERAFHKLLLNFTWWVNRKDAEGRNVFQGGFLGLDNISVFDRSQPLPGGGHLEQADGTAWMGMFCLNMLKIALELSRDNPVYEDIATKFFEHFLYIANSLNRLELWDEMDEFYYDVLRMPNGNAEKLRVRSMVGLIPLLAVEILEPEDLKSFPQFTARLNWFLEHRPDLASLVSRWMESGKDDRHLLALARGHRMKRVLARMLDQTEFLSDYGIRALSRHHLEHPYEVNAEGQSYRIAYEPAESSSGLFGGNSNWRGPIWFPINYLLIESLQKFHLYYTEDFKIECPTGSGAYLSLLEVAGELSKRLIGIFTKDQLERRAVFGENQTFQNDPHWQDLVPFHEYFNGDSGKGVGASHQTGWTGLVATLLHQQGQVEVKETLESMI